LYTNSRPAVHRILEDVLAGVYDPSRLDTPGISALSFQLVLDAIGDGGDDSFVILGGGSHDLSEIAVANQIAVAVAGGVELDRTAEICRLHELAGNRSAQLDQVLTLVDADVHLPTLGNAKGGSVTLFQSKRPAFGPVPGRQGQCIEPLIFVILPGGQATRRPFIPRVDAPLNGGTA
jgi:hypothetical protein